MRRVALPFVAVLTALGGAAVAEEAAGPPPGAAHQQGGDQARPDGAAREERGQVRGHTEQGERRGAIGSR